eukprot:Pgem_evm2s16909
MVIDMSLSAETKMEIHDGLEGLKIDPNHQFLSIKENAIKFQSIPMPYLLDVVVEMLGSDTTNNTNTDTSFFVPEEEEEEVQEVNKTKKIEFDIEKIEIGFSEIESALDYSVAMSYKHAFKRANLNWTAFEISLVAQNKSLINIPIPSFNLAKAGEKGIWKVAKSITMPNNKYIAEGLYDDYINNNTIIGGFTISQFDFTIFNSTVKVPSIAASYDLSHITRRIVHVLPTLMSKKQASQSVSKVLTQVDFSIPKAKCNNPDIHMDLGFHLNNPLPYLTVKPFSVNPTLLYNNSQLASFPVSMGIVPGLNILNISADIHADALLNFKNLVGILAGLARGKGGVMTLPHIVLEGDGKGNKESPPLLRDLFDNIKVDLASLPIDIDLIVGKKTPSDAPADTVPVVMKFDYIPISQVINGVVGNISPELVDLNIMKQMNGVLCGLGNGLGDILRISGL